jgi:hypothetical protein
LNNTGGYRIPRKAKYHRHGLRCERRGPRRGAGRNDHIDLFGEEFVDEGRQAIVIELRKSFDNGEIPTFGPPDALHAQSE